MAVEKEDVHGIIMTQTGIFGNIFLIRLVGGIACTAVRTGSPFGNIVPHGEIQPAVTHSTSPGRQLHFTDLFSLVPFGGNMGSRGIIPEISTINIESIGGTQIIVEHGPLGRRTLLDFVDIDRRRVVIAFAQERQHLMMPRFSPGNTIIANGQIIFIGVDILEQCGTDLLQVTLAVGGVSRATGLVQSGQQHGRQNSDDGDDHQKFDQSKFFHLQPFLNIYLKLNNDIIIAKKL